MCGTFTIGVFDLTDEHGNDPLGYFVLYLENISEYVVVLFRPDLMPRFSGYKAGRNSHTVFCLAYAAAQNISYPQCARRFAGSRFLLAGQIRRAAGRDYDFAEPREAGHNLLGNPFDKVFAIGILAQVGKGQYRDRRPVRWCRNRANSIDGIS